MDLILAGLIFAVIFAVVAVVVLSKGGGEQKEFVSKMMLRPVEGVVDVDITKKRKDHQNAVAIILRQVNFLKNLEQTMWQAGMYWRVSDVLLLMLLLAGAGFAGGEAFWGDYYFALGAAVVFSGLPIMYIRFRRKRRLKLFGTQLPFALDLIKGSLEAGHSLPRALQVLIGEFADPLGSEFRTVLEQTRIGLPLGRALEDMLQRVPVFVFGNRRIGLLRHALISINRILRRMQRIAIVGVDHVAGGASALPVVTRLVVGSGE